MSVTLSPSSQLGFQRPLTQLVKRTLSVSNHNPEPIAYKVKTTAPRTYCVRPNSGRIEPGETVEVQVLLQPMKEDPPASAKCRDKFLVQSVVITAQREGLGLPELWQSVERDDKARAEGVPSQIHEQKIRCTYLPAADSDAVSAIPEETATRLQDNGADSSFSSAIGINPSSNGASSPSPDPASPPGSSTLPAYSTFADSTSTPQPTSQAPLAEKAQNVANSAGTAAASAAASVGLPNLAAAIEDRTPAPASGVNGPPSINPSSSLPAANALTSTSAPPAGSGSEDLATLRSELASARAEISRLKAQLDAAETSAATLRSRGAGAGAKSAGEGVGGTSTAVVEMKGSEGVPVQVVVGVAFGVFVVTWLFF
ncbi:hypothetical protein JCM8547_005148 [Rhodosporidiobolus lusitaniae]